MLFEKRIDRIKLEVFEERDGGNAVLLVPDGWNDTVPILRSVLKREELVDLHYLIDRALDAIDVENARR